MRHVRWTGLPGRLLRVGLAAFGLLLVTGPLAGQERPRDEARPPAGKRADRKASKAYLGAAVAPSREEDKAGVVVRRVTAGSPAEKAGLKSGDRITKVGDTEVRSEDDLVLALAGRKPGDKVAFHVVRGGKDTTVNVTLGESPPRLPEEGPVERAPRERAAAYLGVQALPLNEEVRSAFRVEATSGALVGMVMADGPAAKAGLRRGDVITALDDTKVANPEDLRRAVNKAGAGHEVTLSVQRGKETTTLKAKLAEPPAEGLAPMPIPFPRGPGGFPSVGGDSSRRIGELEKRVQELERRVRELEKRNPPSRKEG
jgi:predicted metalloprotease with PDZ domain